MDDSLRGIGYAFVEVSAMKIDRSIEELKKEHLSRFIHLVSQLQL